MKKKNANINFLSIIVMASFILKTDGTFVEYPLKTLADFQWAVGGNIEAICFESTDSNRFESVDSKQAYCNENAYNLNLPINPWTNFLVKRGFFCWRLIRGDVVLIGFDKELIKPWLQ